MWLDYLKQLELVVPKYHEYHHLHITLKICFKLLFNYVSVSALMENVT